MSKAAIGPNEMRTEKELVNFVMRGIKDKSYCGGLLCGKSEFKRGDDTDGTDMHVLYVGDISLVPRTAWSPKLFRNNSISTELGVAARPPAVV